MDKSKVSERYYLFEDVLWEMPGFAPLKARRPITELQLLAGIVWANEGGAPNQLPLVRTRRKNDASYFVSGAPGTIHLAPKHQGIGGLLHELAHALGTHDKYAHGPAFQKRCIRLYKLYGGWDGNVEWERPKEKL